MKNRIYLDYNATSQIKPKVIDRVCEVLSEVGNPSSVHSNGRTAKMVVETARAAVAKLVGVASNSIIFTGSGTEANNMALRCVNFASIIHSAIEHDSIFAAAKAAVNGTDKPIFIAPVDENGLLDMHALDALLEQAPSPALVSIMLANNETGVIQPLKDISELVHKHGGLFHSDCIQAAGKMFIEFADIGVDMLSISAHKMGGPQGVGALVVRPTMPITAFVVGGGQELGRRSGTENVAGIAGFGVAAELAQVDLPKFMALEQLRGNLEEKIIALAPEVKIWSKNAWRLPNTLAISMPDVSAEIQVMHMDLEGVAVSSGSACSSGKVKESHVIKAMIKDGTSSADTIRISFGYASDASDVDKVFQAWSSLYKRMQLKKSEGE
jgi:cysteine desulfurase